jgi:hypothetical protein
LRAVRLKILLESYRVATKQRPPPGYILVHNRVETILRTGEDTPGFRVWWTRPGAEFVACDCGWRPDLGEHYRIQRLGPLIPRRRRCGVRPASARS